MLTTIKRVVLIGAVAGALLYAGGSCNIQRNVIDPIFNNKPIEDGYVNPRSVGIEKHVNDAGRVQGYVVYSNGEEKYALPILKNGSGFQVGEDSYWWGSLLTSAERSGFVVSGWNELALEKKEELITRDWETIGKDTKYQIVKGELEKALDAFYEQNTKQGSVR